MTVPNEIHAYDWKIMDIDHDKRMVVLVSSSTPTVKRFGVPSAIERAEVNGPVLRIYCEDLVAWEVQVSDGARRKLKQEERR